MKREIKLCCGLGVLLFLCASCAYKSYVKEGAKYEENGMYNQAVTSYLNSLAKKPAYVDARIGLLRSGMLYATELEDKIEKAYGEQNDNEVVNYYLQLKELQREVKPYNLEISIAERTDGQYDEAKNRFLNTTYEQAQQAINDELYNKAQTYLYSILKVDGNFKNSKELLVVARCEPVYQQGMTAYSQGSYRKAYNFWREVEKIDNSYKDVTQREADAIHMGMRLIAFEEITNCQNYESFCDQMRSAVRTTINGQNDPFMLMVELAEHRQLVEAQKKMMDDVDQVASQNLIPVNTIINATLKITSKTTPLTQKKRKGYLKHVDKEKNVTYTKVYYQEYYKKCDVRVEFSFVIVGTPSGERLNSGTLTPMLSDELHYIYYDGKNESSLVPGYWEKDGKFNPDKDYIQTDYVSVSKLKRMINSKRELKSRSVMESELSKTVAKLMSKEILTITPKN